MPPAATPSTTARLTGVAISVVTVALAVTIVRDALSGDGSTSDAALRIAVGVFLVLLGLVVGALSLFPAQLRRMIRGA
jgi:ABC-type nickel/cobalt efflux system permease component RcnA